ncbi:hypothetical protein ACVILK_000508 [Bradyrhizobium embrapense]
MTRYFFDIRKDGYLIPDEEGLDFNDIRSAKLEAAHTLADLARDVARAGKDEDLTIDVRTSRGVTFSVSLTFRQQTH